MQVDTSTLISIRVLETINAELRNQVNKPSQEPKQHLVANCAMVAIGTLTSASSWLLSWTS